MKKIFACMSVLGGLLCMPLQGQEYVEDVSVLSEAVVPKELNLPIVRTVYGGTKIIPIYEGNWTNEMKGAFEYACKIWEEAMPTTFPIKIKVVLDETNSMYLNKSVLSSILTKVHSHAGESFSYDPFSAVSTVMQIKGTFYDEFSGKSQTHIYDGILDETMFLEPDVVIRYYNYKK